MTLGDDVIMAIRTGRTWTGECPHCGETLYGDTKLAEEINTHNNGWVTCGGCDEGIQTTDIHMTPEFQRTVWRHPDASPAVRVSP